MQAIQQLRTAEAALVQQIDRATQAVEAIGTDAVEDALARLREAALAARVRISNATAGLEGMLRALTADLAFEAREIEADLATPVATPVREERPIAERSEMFGSRMEATQEPAAVEADQEPSEKEIAPQADTQQDDDPNMVDIGWEPTQEELDREDQRQAVTSAACPPASRGRGKSSRKKQR